MGKRIFQLNIYVGQIPIAGRWNSQRSSLLVPWLPLPWCSECNPHRKRRDYWACIYAGPFLVILIHRRVTLGCTTSTVMWKQPFCNLGICTNNTGICSRLLDAEIHYKFGRWQSSGNSICSNFWRNSLSNTWVESVSWSNLKSYICTVTWFLQICERSLTATTGGPTGPPSTCFVRAEMLPSGYLIRPCEGGGSTIHIVDHIDFDVWNHPTIFGINSVSPMHPNFYIVAGVQCSRSFKATLRIFQNPCSEDDYGR